MTIEYRESKHAARRVVMTACPFCDHEFTPDERRHVHLRDDCEAAPRETPHDTYGETDE